MNDSLVHERPASKISPSSSVDAAALSSAADKAALDFCVFEHNANSPMSDASLARLFYRHIPAFVKMDEEAVAGIEPSKNEFDSPRALARYIEHDMVAGREYADWLAPHLSKQSADLFSRGRSNSFDPVFDRLARLGGYERDDILIRESGSSPSMSKGDQMDLSENRRKSHMAAAQMAARNMGMDF